MTPGSRQAKACEPTSIDATVAGAVEDQQDLLAVVGRVVGLDVERPGDRRRSVRQPRVGEDRRCRAARRRRPSTVRRSGRRAGREAEDVDHLAGLVVDDHVEPGPAAGSLPLVGRAVLGRVAADRDDVVARASCAEPVVAIQLRVVEPGDERQPVRPAVERDGRRRASPLGGSMNATPSPVATAIRGSVVDRDAGQACRRRSRPRATFACRRCPGFRGRRSRRARRRQPRLVVGGVAAEDARRRVCRDGARVGHRGRCRHDQRRAAVPPGARSAMPVETRPCRGRRRRSASMVVTGRIGRGHDRAVVGRRAGARRVVHGQRSRRRAAGAAPSARRSSDGRGRASRSVRRRSRRPAGCRSRRWPARWRPAPATVETSWRGSQVVGPDLGPGRDVQALAGAVAGRSLVDAARLDAAARTGDPEVARRR